METKHCVRCGDKFQGHKLSQYCWDCKRKRQREQNQAWKNQVVEKECPNCKEKFVGKQRKIYCDTCLKRRKYRRARALVREKAISNGTYMDKRLKADGAINQPVERLSPKAQAYEDYDTWTAATHYELRYYDWNRRRMVTAHAMDVGRSEDRGMANRQEMTEAGMV